MIFFLITFIVHNQKSNGDPLGNHGVNRRGGGMCK